MTRADSVASPSRPALSEPSLRQPARRQDWPLATATASSGNVRNIVATAGLDLRDGGLTATAHTDTEAALKVAVLQRIAGGKARQEAQTLGYAPTEGNEYMPTKAGTPEPMQPLMFGYQRVSTDEQAISRNGLDAQHDTITAEGIRRGWTLEHFADEGVSGKAIGPQLAEVLQLLDSGQGDGLVVAKLDRLSRSIVNAANIIEAAQAQG